MKARLDGIIIALWFIPFTAVNVLIWRYIPCEWHFPYQERGRKHVDIQRHPC